MYKSVIVLKAMFFLPQAQASRYPKHFLRQILS
jgi:hypothetical protein